MRAIQHTRIITRCTPYNYTVMKKIAERLIEDVEQGSPCQNITDAVHFDLDLRYQEPRSSSAGS